MTRRHRLGFATRLAAPSALATLAWRRAGARGLLLAEGKPPVVVRGGDIDVRGTVSVRGTVARAELGAVPGGRLVIGPDVFVNSGASLVAHHLIEIGPGCRIGDFAAVYDAPHHPLDAEDPMAAEPVVLDEGVWLARGALVLPGVRIGRHSVVGAGAVVTRDVPSGVLVVGSPARVVRSLRLPEGWRRP